jgi:hypothetical protein
MIDDNKKVKAADSTFTAGDLKNASGMSYRQINDWDAKGTLPNQREQGTSWRKFSLQEMFAIVVCKEIRDRFGTPLGSLRFVRNFMLQNGANHLQTAVDIMRYGFAVFILTDLREIFVMDSDLEFEDLFHLGYLRAAEDQGYVFIQVNNLVNRLLACLETPAALHIHDKNYEAVRQGRAERIMRNERELAIIRAIRLGDYEQVKLTKKNDAEMLLDVQQDLSEFEAAKDPNSTIVEHDFQTLTVSRHAGKNVRVKANPCQSAKAQAKVRAPIKRQPPPSQREPGRIAAQEASPDARERT